MWHGIEFAYPKFFLLFIILPLMVAWYLWKYRKNQAEIRISSFEGLQKGKTARLWLVHGLFVLRLVAISAIIIALARPQSSSSRKDVNVEGIDIVIAQDISGSMLAEDFKPNRLVVARNEALNFIKGRPNDRIGLVIFSGESFTQCPITTDHAVLSDLLSKVETGMIEDGTALGDGLATAVSRLKDSKAVSKVIILLTDGVNNAGSIDPQSAAEIAKLYKVRVYCIGIGTKGLAPYPFKTPFGIQYQNVNVEVDDALMQKIAATTGGQYFRATNNKKLEEIYAQIDQMEKTRIDVLEFRKKHEEFLPLVLLALGLFLLEIILRYTIFRTNP